ncbi:MAG: sugar phosphate isomerase/epimerase family protein [Limisphaerales bacterium]
MLALSLLVVAGANRLSDAQEKTAAASVPKFFPLDNGVGRGSWTPAQQADCVQELGFDGIGYNYTRPEDLAAWLKALSPRGLKLYSLYFGITLDQEDPYPAGLREALPMLKGSSTILWVTVARPRVGGEWDAVAARRIDALAELAARQDLRVAIYPHLGLYVATAEDALRVLSRVTQTNVGVTVNLCHELASGNGPRLQEVIAKAAPRLMLATICGATDKKDDAGGWSTYIQTLDRGDYDVFGMLVALERAGYRGPIGLQCYSIKGDPKENLRKSMRAWRSYMARLAAQKPTK